MTLADSILAAPPAAAGPSLADWLTAGGTVLLALITAVTLIVTVRITRADRRHDDKIRAEDRAQAATVLGEERARAERDRADAAQRLQDERELAAQRLRDERDHAEKTRRHERRSDNADALIQRIATLQPYLAVVPGVWIRRDRGPGGHEQGVRYLRDDGCLAAVDTLLHGVWAETTMLGRDDVGAVAAARYRYLVKLVEDLARHRPEKPKRDVRTLRNYARWVRISLRELAEDGAVPPIYGGSPEFPLLGLAEEMPPWLPHPLPPGWTDELDHDPVIAMKPNGTAGPAREKSPKVGD